MSTEPATPETAPAVAAPAPEPEWARYKDEELLKLRICDLALKVEQTSLAPMVEQLHAELAARGLEKLKPAVYFGDEWFSPEGMAVIAVPFFLAHPRLRELERKMMLEVEGEDPEYFMKLIRHEAGHCFDHAFRFSRQPRWRELFGSPNQEYAPETYRPRPYSRSYVRNIENWYAQAHPDEDFAETFAVWVNPAVDWRKDYKQWAVALAKLEYVDLIAKKSQTMRWRAVGGSRPCDASRMRTTLERYYARRRRERAEAYPDFYDNDLRLIFGGDQALGKREHGAARFMAKQRKVILESVAYWTGERKYTIDGLLKRLIRRCDELDLRVGKTEAETSMEVAAFLATLVMNYLFTGKFRRTV